MPDSSRLKVTKLPPPPFFFAARSNNTFSLIGKIVWQITYTVLITVMSRDIARH